MPLVNDTFQGCFGQRKIGVNVEVLSVAESRGTFKAEAP